MKMCENREVADDVIKELEASKKRKSEEFITQEDMQKEFLKND